MPDIRRSAYASRLWSLVLKLADAELIKLIIDGLDTLRSVVGERASDLYEVRYFDHTLELCDPQGSKAIYRKHETVQLLQDHVFAYLDYAWGRGEIFADYRCSPGTPVDRYRYGHKTCILISLREIRRRGEILFIRIDRTVRNGFRAETGWSETVVRHKTHHFRIAVIFPAERLPKHVALVEVNRNRTTSLGEANTEVMPDGRHQVFWETTKPTLFETYTLRWTW